MPDKNETKKLSVISEKNIKSKIYVVRGVQVVLDYDLAEMYEVPTKRLNEQVKRNKKRFPNHYMFQLTKEEKNKVVANCDYLQNLKFSPNLPYVFTEQGVSQVSAVLNSDIAIEVSIRIIDAFVAMRKILSQNGQIYQRLSNVEQMQIEHTVELKEHNSKINQLFKILEDEKDIPKQKVYFENQIYDAYELLLKIIRSAKKSIIIVDNYIDDSVFTILNKRKNNVCVKIYTKNISKELRLDLEKHNSQYLKIDILEFKLSHDRFMIIDNKEVYHFGASLKDLGKKWFGFFKVEKEAMRVVERLGR